MTVPQLSVTSAALSDVVADILVVGVISSSDGPRLLVDDTAIAEQIGSLEAIGITGALDEVRRLPLTGFASASLALVGVGPSSDANDLRYASGSATRQLHGVASVALALPTAAPGDLVAVLEGAALGAWDYTEYRSSSLDGRKAPPATVIVISPIDPASAEAGEALSRAAIVAGAVDTVRNLVSAPPSDLYPESFACEVENLAQDLPVDVSVLDEAALREGGYGGILGVGIGSTRGPRLVKVSYAPTEATTHLAIVGKGITFDSGGLSLKPAASMMGMKYDMTGAATALAVTLAAARLGLSVRITAWLCLAENLPSGSAVRPNDVLTIRGGKTVEVTNTDAEGRLVLADGLVAASEEEPDAIIDVATLTGAARVALGDRYVGAMGDDALIARLIVVAEKEGEQFWQMPLPAELRKRLNSDIADLVNATPGNPAAGMLLAGVFLREFVGSRGEGDQKAVIPWAHLDIAAPANNAGAPWGFVGKGATGVTVRTLLALAEEFSAA